MAGSLVSPTPDFISIDKQLIFMCFLLLLVVECR